MSQHSSRGTEWEKVRQQVLQRDGYLCVVIGCNEQATTVDHIQPKSLGGSDTPSNLQAMCARHNMRKGAKVSVRSNYLNERFFS